MKRATINIRCTEDYKKRIEKAAEERGTTVTAYIKNALFEQTKRDERK